ncbi:hypothetical protein BCV72DRAFT_239141 [Rhizopus microsporus var. microsporus]|uniref:Uncharacterized protein n=2 Tax=Rhizopus microsporus TaxID=58291 RepID=A0A2G4ST00_RHIZD|nr:uncharacterized protein RHIMIDRAFT_244328 [Rhizopus microsporus ATCC 52813]ORE10109.1 hypothetical protein BCV72DRAFT_239141 [Rhizopus microsporus var. microsporus]PHZ11881.1 hypothetical protein RHIMIDRAFT_244328 [Rhizopus microsporus ATCC 52813]
MNRLGFADFHAKHFGPEQQEYWKQFLRNQQQYYHQQSDEQSSQLTSDYSYYYNHNNEPTDLEEEQVEVDKTNDDYGLSKEAIEIFRFSEAYRKERDEERLKQEEADQVGKEDWKFDESSVICSGGSEAPATCLVLTQKSKQQSENLRMKEDILNSEYLSSCTNKDTDAPVVLWPILPLKL